MMNISSSLLFDAAFVLIFVISIIWAAKRGAFKAISGIAGTVAGLIGGLLFQERIAPQVESFLTPMVEKTIGNWDFSKFMELSSETISSLSQELADVIAAWQQSSGGQKSFVRIPPGGNLNGSPGLSCRKLHKIQHGADAMGGSFCGV